MQMDDGIIKDDGIMMEKKKIPSVCKVLYLFRRDSRE